LAEMELQTQIDSDALLQASRRVDWRFLLPDPKLGRVAYIGLEQNALLQSLQLFAESLDVFEPAAINSSVAGQFDVVVVRSPDFVALRGAVALMRPGGYLYIEGSGLLWSLRQRTRRKGAMSLQKPRLWSPADHVAFLGELGLSEAQTYWVWPNFERCTRMLPLDDRLVFLSSRRSSWGAALGPRLRRSKVIRQLTHSRFAGWFIPHFCIVATKAT
jgi:hypothetical protein